MSSSETLNDRDFEFVQDLVYKNTGIVIGDHKREMIYRRLSRRMRDLDVVDLNAYCNILRSDNKDEMVNFINAVTTNLTSFFRENHHFEFLSKEYFPAFIENGSKRLRIWSSACSTGEEPYSIAMTLLDSAGDKLTKIDAKILATDLDTHVLKTGRDGIYDANRVKDISSAAKVRWFDKLEGADKYSIKVAVKQLITFNKLNLLGQWPMKGKFDIIFCRNVLIYFDKPTQETLVKRFYDILQPGGILMLGHSESILKGSKEFHHLGKTIYRK